jgi:glycosyltransferase involved in cell wall biosynthesis
MNSNPKMAFIDHEFHKKTRSTEFLRKMLSSSFTIQNYWINPWGDNKSISTEEMNIHEYVFYFQRISPLSELKKINGKISWAQMYDSANFDYFYWKNLSYLPSFKILAFSKKIHAQCKKFGIESLSLTYYMDPTLYDFKIPENGRHVFFWYRGSISWKVVRELLDPDQIDSVLYISNPDPNYKKEEISEKDKKLFNMTILQSDFSSQEQYLTLVSKANIFISPRKREGIGMSFIEALAMGQCVIAHNDGTMNEYIVHGKNGYLFNANNPKRIDLSHHITVRNNSVQDAQKGYLSWLESVNKIIPFLHAPSPKISHSFLERMLFEKLYLAKLTFHPYKEKLKTVLKRVLNHS